MGWALAIPIHVLGGYTPVPPTHIPVRQAPPSTHVPVMSMQRQAVGAMGACTYGRFWEPVGEPRGSRTHACTRKVDNSPKECLKGCQNVPKCA